MDRVAPGTGSVGSARVAWSARWRGVPAVSGPKGYDYAVRAAELVRQRAVGEARARCRELWERATRDAAEAAGYGDAAARADRVPRIADSATAEEAQAIADEYAEAARAVARRRDAARAAATARTFADAIPAALEGSIDLQWSTSFSALPAAGTAHASESASEDAADPLPRILEALVHVSDVARRDSWLARATELAGLGASARLRALSVEVHTHLREQSRAEAVVAEAADVALTLAGIDSPSATAARAALSAARDRESLRSAAALAKSAREQDLAAAERRYVIEQTIEALAELGYEVDAEFRTTVLAGGFAVAPKEALADHALQIRFDAGTGRMHTNTVALRAGTTRSADIAAETATCADLDAMGELLREEGVSLQRFHALAPGALEVERRLDVAAGATRSRTRRRDERSEKERGR